MSLDGPNVASRMKTRDASFAQTVLVAMGLDTSLVAAASSMVVVLSGVTSVTAEGFLTIPA